MHKSTLINMLVCGYSKINGASFYLNLVSAQTSTLAKPMLKNEFKLYPNQVGN